MYKIPFCDILLTKLKSRSPLMKPMICEHIAPPEVFGFLHEIATGQEAKAFVERTLQVAEREEGLSTYDTNGNPNSRTVALMIMLQARMTGEVGRKELLSDGDLVLEITNGNRDDLMNWDGITLALLFASDDLLDRMIENIPPSVRSTVIAQMPTEQQTQARSKFTN
jgi:hypothetical protein